MPLVVLAGAAIVVALLAGLLLWLHVASDHDDRLFPVEPDDDVGG